MNDRRKRPRDVRPATCNECQSPLLLLDESVRVSWSVAHGVIRYLRTTTINTIQCADCAATVYREEIPNDDLVTAAAN